jgi:hypothetical protein
MLVYVISKILPGTILLLVFPGLFSYPTLPYSAAVISISSFSLRSLTFDPQLKLYTNAIHD